MVTQDRLRELLSYCPESGAFTRIKSVKGRFGASGSVAGTRSLNGYTAIFVDGVRYQAHRLAFLYMDGEMPPAGVDVDHINGRRDDNRWANLRLASRAQNMWNVSCRGFSRCKQTGKFAAKIKVDGKRIWLGRHDTEAEAAAAYQEAARRYHGEYAKR